MQKNNYIQNDHPEMINDYPMLREFSRTIGLRKVLRFGVPWFYYVDIEEELRSIYEQWREVWIVIWLLVWFLMSSVFGYIFFIVWKYEYNANVTARSGVKMSIWGLAVGTGWELEDKSYIDDQSNDRKHK